MRERPSDEQCSFLVTQEHSTRTKSLFDFDFWIKKQIAVLKPSHIATPWLDTRQIYLASCTNALYFLFGATVRCAFENNVRKY